MQNDIKKSKKKAPIICAAVVIAFLGIFLATILFPLIGEVMGEALAVGFLLIYGISYMHIIEKFIINIA